jgi:cellulose synthase/poly-beta-1,6-N-acetylglucosamine synthase-like glycosyltransferase
MSYWSYETALKRWESECGTILGATGGVYAIRRDLFAPLPVDRPVVDDFLTPLQVVRRGYRMVYEPAAIAYEDASDSIDREFRRRVRIGAQDFSSIRYFADLLNPLRGFVAFALWSHKILRWCVPFFALGVLATTVILAGDSSFYAWVLAIELAILAAALLGWITERLRLRVGLLGVPYYFVAMNLALFVGFLTFVSGRQKGTWEVLR